MQLLQAMKLWVAIGEDPKKGTTIDSWIITEVQLSVKHAFKIMSILPTKDNVGAYQASSHICFIWAGKYLMVLTYGLNHLTFYLSCYWILW